VTAVDPLVRRSLTFFRRGPAWSIAIALAVAAFALARATAPLVTDAAADRSFAAEVATAATSATAGQGLDARAYTTGLADLSAEQAVSDLLDELPVYDRPLVSVSPLLPYSGHDHPTPVIRTLEGKEAPAVVFSVGESITSLQPTSTTLAADPSAGIWVPDTLATSLGISPGDNVLVGFNYPSFVARPEQMVDAPTTIAGVYVTADGLPVSETFDWGSTPSPLPTDPSGAPGTAPLLLADTGTAMSLIAAMDDSPFVRWDMPWTGPVSIEQGRDASAAVKATADELLNTESLVGRQVSDAHAQRVVLSSGVQTFVPRSERAAETLHPVLVSIALTAQVMSLLVIATSIWMLSRARRREHALSLSMGASPVRLGALAALEQLIPIVAGVGVAYVVVRWYPGLVAGEGAIDRSTLQQATRPVLWALPIALAAVAVAGFAAVWPMDAASEGRAKRVAGALRAETIVVVAAVATGAQLLTQKGGATLNSGTSLLFPLLAVLAGSVLVVRGTAAVVRSVNRRRVRRKVTGAHARRPKSLAIWLARRRVSYSLTELSALVIVVASGVGLFVYCTSISADGRRGVLDKAAAIGGASATAAIDSVQNLPHDPAGFPTGLPAGSTVVWSLGDAQMAPNVVADVLAVDPETFPAAAAWRTSFAGQSLDSLLSDVGDSEPFTADIVVAGNYTDTFPDHGTMQLERGLNPVQYRVVGRIAAAPWQRERSSLAIVSARSLAPMLPDVTGALPKTPDASQLDRIFSTYVWSDGDQTDLEASLGTDLRASEAPNVPQAERLPSFVAFSLSLPYLRLVGTALLFVSLASIIVLGARRRADLALELAMTDKMGMRRRTMATAVAGGAALLGIIASLIGIVLARLLVGFMIHRLDPSPAFAPSFSGSLSSSATLVAVAGVVVVSLAAAWLELRGARRARVAEVLRGAE
jgi:FtsX-like permease family